MARYGSDQKQATRQRILDTAGRRFKRCGIDGSGVAALMADAGLTNGAFYAHFSSKNDLVATSIGDQLARQCEDIGALVQQPGGVEAFVRLYLSPDHRDHAEEGCPSAALLDEIGRSTPAIKQSYTDGVLSFVDAVAAAVAPHDPLSARATVLDAFAMMVGALQISRAVNDGALAEEILDNVAARVLAMLGSD
jgi:TetR/AcrR family transcriptional regulator, transcriptional repressor for nem operon